MSSIDHLHSEAEIMPVEDHHDMLSTQFLINSLRVSHPLHAAVTAPPGPRKMKETLHSKFGNKAAPYLDKGVTDPLEYKSNLKKIHIDYVASSIQCSGNNQLLGSVQPSISPSEKRLSRFQQTTLSQLRSGHYRFLQGYRLHVCQSTSDTCP